MGRLVSTPPIFFLILFATSAPASADSTAFELHVPHKAIQLEAPYTEFPGDTPAFFGLQHRIFFGPDAQGWFVNPLIDPDNAASAGSAAGYQWAKDRFTLSVEVGRAYRVWAVGTNGQWDTVIIMKGGIFF